MQPAHGRLDRWTALRGGILLVVLGHGHCHWQHEPCWCAVEGAGHWRAGWREKREVTVLARPLAQWTDEKLLRVLEAVQGTAAPEDPDETPGEG